METLVATVLIVILFTVASLLLNSLFGNNIRAADPQVTERLQELKYEYRHGAFSLPYYESLGDWEFSASSGTAVGGRSVVFKAENANNRKTYTEYALYER